MSIVQDLATEVKPTIRRAILPNKCGAHQPCSVLFLRKCLTARLRTPNSSKDYHQWFIQIHPAENHPSAPRIALKTIAQTLLCCAPPNSVPHIEFPAKASMETIPLSDSLVERSPFQCPPIQWIFITEKLLTWSLGLWRKWRRCNTGRIETEKNWFLSYITKPSREIHHNQ